MNKEAKREHARRQLEAEYREGRARFLSRARAVTDPLEDAEDVVHDAFLAAYRNLDAVAVVSSATAWIYTAVRNRMTDLWRREQTRIAAGQVDVAGETIEEIIAAVGLDPADALVQEELIDALSEAIDELPVSQREIILAQVFEGSTFREISQQTGVAIETLSARKRAAIRALGVTLREWIEEG